MALEGAIAPKTLTPAEFVQVVERPGVSGHTIKILVSSNIFGIPNCRDHGDFIAQTDEKFLIESGSLILVKCHARRI